MAADSVRGRIGEALALAVDEDWTDVLIVGRRRNGDIRILFPPNDLVTAIGMVQSADMAIRATARLAPVEPPLTSGTTIKGTN